jgi:hypothetical protein
MVVGQGGPLTVNQLSRVLFQRLPHGTRWIVPLLLAALWLVGTGSICAADELDLRLNFAWGGGESRQWRGRILLSAGLLRDIQLMGVDSDQPGSILADRQQIVVAQKQARSYDSFQVQVQGPREATLRIELLPEGERTARAVVVTLGDLIERSHSQELDNQGNRLVVRRTPDDLIRVQIPRQNLIFSPGEPFPIKIEAVQLGLPEDTPIRCTAELYPIDHRAAIWQETYRAVTDAQGSWTAGQMVNVTAPAGEGVYDLELTIFARRGTVPFTSERTIAARRVQFVVVDDTKSGEPTAADSKDAPTRELIWEIDPSQANWWHRLTRLPQWSLLPGFRTDGPLGNVKTQRMTRGEQTWTELPVGGWQAYPLSIDEVGVPHELELRFSSDAEQTFAVSVVEPNAAGKVIPVGLDSAVHVSDESVRGIASTPAPSATHRVLFWPRTRSPLLLVTNLSDKRSSLFGSFQVYRTNLASPAPSDPKRKNRVAFAYWDRPLFPENFGASEALDVESGRSLEDWQTFLDGAKRMIAFAQHSGYDGLAVMCASEGSTLYPSRLLQPTPKHDRGPYFSNGQDPLRKDVLELLFRLCDRAGLQFVPVMEFATPLPILEQYLADESRAVGVRLVDAAQVTWTERFPAQRGRGAYYNPLNDQVQAAMRDVVRELVQRYAHHRSFAGISVSLRPDGFTQMPDVDWGLDSETWAQFRRDTKVPHASYELMDEATRARWMDWRCERLAELYRAMAHDVSSGHPDARLYLAGARLIESRPVQRAWRPTLPARPDSDLALRELGLDPARLRELPNVVMLRPRLFADETDADEEAVKHAFNESLHVDRMFRHPVTSGSQFLHEPRLMRLPSFDELSPFGSENTFLSLVAHVSPAGAQNRERFARALAREDAQVLFEGGWMMPLGQTESVREFLQAYRQLPRIPFEATKGESRRWQPLTIRWAHTEDASYLYAVNESPWLIGANITLVARPSAQFSALGEGPRPAVRPERGRQIWSLALEPYQVVAIRADLPGVTVEDAEVSLPPAVKPGLEGQIYQLNLRAAQLRNPRSMPVPPNAGFEQWDDVTKLPEGWTVREGRGSVRRELRDVHEGQSAVLISLPSGSLGLRSPVFAPDDAGRLSISIRAKVPEGATQPRMRLIIEIDGRSYYPWSPIGVGTGGRALTDQWKEFVFRVNQLPPINESFRLGIEFGGAGEVMIDDLKLYDTLVLDNGEQNALKMLLIEADFHARNGYVTDCMRLLRGFWPQYLIQNVPEVPGEMVDAPAPPRDQIKRRLDPTPAEEPAEREAAGWIPWRRLLPRR